LSRRHGVFYKKGNKFFYEDLKTANGSWVKIKTNDSIQLKDKMVLKFGEALQY